MTTCIPCQEKKEAEFVPEPPPIAYFSPRDIFNITDPYERYETVDISGVRFEFEPVDEDEL